MPPGVHRCANVDDGVRSTGLVAGPFSGARAQTRPMMSPEQSTEPGTQVGSRIEVFHESGATPARSSLLHVTLGRAVQPVRENAVENDSEHDIEKPEHSWPPKHARGRPVRPHV